MWSYQILCSETTCKPQICSTSLSLVTLCEPVRASANTERQRAHAHAHSDMLFDVSSFYTVMQADNTAAKKGDASNSDPKKKLTTSDKV
jgi:hypothetical protein